MQIFIPPNWTLENHDMEGRCRIKQVSFSGFFPSLVSLLQIYNTQLLMCNQFASGEKNTAHITKLMLCVCVCKMRLLLSGCPQFSISSICSSFLPFSSFHSWNEKDSLLFVWANYIPEKVKQHLELLTDSLIRSQTIPLRDLIFNFQESKQAFSVVR